MATPQPRHRVNWMQEYWRPMMAYLYMLICFADFVVFPVLWALLHSVVGAGGLQQMAQAAQWQPLTLQTAGFFHIAMGAVLGISSFGRSQEKLAGVYNGAPTMNTPDYNNYYSGNNYQNVPPQQHSAYEHCVPEQEVMPAPTKKSNAARQRKPYAAVVVPPTDMGGQ